MDNPLTPQALDALDRIETAIENIEALRRRINAANEAHGLGLPDMTLPQLGMYLHQVGGVAYEHGLAVVKRQARLALPLEKVAA